MLIWLAILAYQYVVNSNVARMSHGRFQSFHHHALVILMSCMTWWRFALLVFTHRTARQMLENIARPSQRFIVLLNLLFYKFFSMQRVSSVCAPPVARARMERKYSPAFSRFYSQTSQWLDNRCMCRRSVLYLLNVSIDTIDLKRHRFGYNKGNVNYFIHKKMRFFLTLWRGHFSSSG